MNRFRPSPKTIVIVAAFALFLAYAAERTEPISVAAIVLQIAAIWHACAAAIRIVIHTFVIEPFQVMQEINT